MTGLANPNRTVVCICGHAEEQHEHYRKSSRNTECSSPGCKCPHFARPALDRLLERLRR